MKILDLGCGERKHPGSTGIDNVPLKGVDIVHDLNAFPYPLEENAYDKVIMKHVAEHILDVVGLMKEVHRVGKSGGVVEIHTPHFTSSNAYADPTHLHHFSLFAFDFFCGRTVHGYIPKSHFKMLRKDVQFWPLHDKIPWLNYQLIGMGWMARKHTNFYERFLTFLFPIQEFRVTLEIIK